MGCRGRERPSPASATGIVPGRPGIDPAMRRILSDMFLPGCRPRTGGLPMRFLKLASFPLLVLALTVGTAAQTFKPYPGASKYTPPDTPENRELLKAMPAGVT